MALWTHCTEHIGCDITPEDMYSMAGGGTTAFDRDRHRELMIEHGYWTPPKRPTTLTKEEEEKWQEFLSLDPDWNPSR